MSALWYISLPRAKLPSPPLLQLHRPLRIISRPTTIMANSEQPVEDTHHKVPTHPIPPRLKDGPKTPHIGPHFHAYKYRFRLLFHAPFSVANRHSDPSTARPSVTRAMPGGPRCVSNFVSRSLRSRADRRRSQRKPFIGTAPSTPSAQEASRRATSSGSPRAA